MNPNKNRAKCCIWCALRLIAKLPAWNWLHVYHAADKIIVNFPTKKHWRNPSQLIYIEAGLETFVADYERYGITSVAFPQLGCGNGELGWEGQVKPVMERYLKDLPIPVYIHLYPK